MASFIRYDQLADTFKVQKIRKTVNEYYMVGAGLPDPDVLVGARERALAITALAFSMVHVMDVINSEQLMIDLGVVLQCQVGILIASLSACGLHPSSGAPVPGGHQQRKRHRGHHRPQALPI